MHMHSPFLYSILSFTLYLLSHHLQHLFLCLFVCFSDVFPHTTHLLSHISKRLFQQLHVTAFLSSLSFFSCNSPFSCIWFIRIIKGDFTSSISVWKVARLIIRDRLRSSTKQIQHCRFFQVWSHLRSSSGTIRFVQVHAWKVHLLAHACSFKYIILFAAYTIKHMQNWPKKKERKSTNDDSSIRQKYASTVNVTTEIVHPTKAHWKLSKS